MIFKWTTWKRSLLNGAGLNYAGQLVSSLVAFKKCTSMVGNHRGSEILCTNSRSALQKAAREAGEFAVDLMEALKNLCQQQED